MTESYRKVSVTHELTCTKESLQVPLDSFFFNGEPGGGIGIKLDKVERKGESFLVKKGLSGDTFQELKALAARVPTEGSGAAIAPATLEVERKMTVRGKEPIEGPGGVEASFEFRAAYNATATRMMTAVLRNQQAGTEYA